VFKVANWVLVFSKVSLNCMANLIGLVDSQHIGWFIVHCNINIAPHQKHPWTNLNERWTQPLKID
jgi:hypothetical protein